MTASGTDSTPNTNESSYDEAAEAVFDSLPDDAFGDDPADPSEIEGTATPAKKPEPKSKPDDAADPGEDGNIDPDDDSEALDDLGGDDDPEDAEPSPEWNAAAEALLESGFTAAEIAELSDEQVIKLGTPRIKEAEPDNADATGEQAETVKDPEDKGGDKPEATPAISAEQIKAKAVEALSKSNQWDSNEADSIADAISQTVEAALAGFKPEQSAQPEVMQKLERQVAQQQDALLEMKADRHALTLSDQYPEISDSDGLQEVKTKIRSMVQKGMRFKTIEDAVDAAALTLWGKKRTSEIRQHQKRINKAKQSGVPGTGKSVIKDDTVSGDSWDQAANQAWNQVVLKK